MFFFPQQFNITHYYVQRFSMPFIRLNAICDFIVLYFQFVRFHAHILQTESGGGCFVCCGGVAACRSQVYVTI